jgi:release factor glutamine methyltransferase
MPNERKRSIREAFAEASLFLRENGVLEPESNAQLLLEHLLGVDRTGLFLRWTEMFPVEHYDTWQQLLERKAAGEPVQYIRGEQEFYGLPFTVTPAVLIPRPETELLVERVVQLGKLLWPGAVESGDGDAAGGRHSGYSDALSSSVGEGSGRELLRSDGGDSESEREAGAPARGVEGPLVADIGVGSGAIAVSLAVQCPGWRLVASDISPEALEVARGNSERHGVGQRVAFWEGDLLGPFIERGVRLDAVVSNPPYIPEADEAGLQPEVRLYEPRTALYGGADGLEPYRRLTAQLRLLPAMPKLVGFEVGLGQAEAVWELLEQAADWSGMEIVKDLAGIARHVIAYRT